MTEIGMPRLSDSMEEGTILSWLKDDGDEVAVGDELVEIETDKATMTYEAPAGGTLRIVAAVGETLPVGAPIAQLGAEAPTASVQPVETPDPAPPAAASAPADAAPADPAPADPAATTVTATGPGTTNQDGNENGSRSHVRATPLARRMASVHGVDLDDMEGTGPRGRITRADVAASAGIEEKIDTAPAPTRHDPEISPAFRDGSPNAQELTRTQKLIARRMAEAKATIPHFQVQTEADIGALLGLRAQLRDQPSPPDPMPSLNDFIVKACALALRRHPRANGSYRDGRFELHEQVNVGIAVAAADALVVPTISDADSRSVGAIARDARRLAAKVRDGSVTPGELAGATFTVSNLGMYGMTAITPVINPPQAAILGVGAARPVLALAKDSAVTERQLMTLTLSCDHRILYGADAAEFLSDIRGGLESPLTLLL